MRTNGKGQANLITGSSSLWRHVPSFAYSHGAAPAELAGNQTPNETDRRILGELNESDADASDGADQNHLIASLLWIVNGEITSRFSPDLIKSLKTSHRISGLIHLTIREEEGGGGQKWNMESWLGVAVCFPSVSRKWPAIISKKQHNGRRESSKPRAFFLFFCFGYLFYFSLCFFSQDIHQTCWRPARLAL